MQLQITCPGCSQQYTSDNPPHSLISCGHTFCRKCLRQATQPISKQKSKVVCPEDEKQSLLETGSELPKNMALLAFIESRQKNTSAQSMQSIKDESFNVAKVNHSNEEDEDAVDLITAITTGEETRQNTPLVEEDKTQVESTASSQIRVRSPSKFEPEMCLPHNKPIEFVCLTEKVRLCSKCAIFGEHKNHQIVSNEQIEQGNKSHYSELLDIFNGKADVKARFDSKTAQKGLLEVLATKGSKMKRQVAEVFRRVSDDLARAEKKAYRDLEETLEVAEKRIKKICEIDKTTLSSYEEWEEDALYKYTEHQSGSYEGILSFFVGGEELVQEGKALISRLRNQEQFAFAEVDRLIDDLSIVKNETPCLDSIGSIIEIYENKKQAYNRISSPYEKQNQKKFMNKVHYDSSARKIKTQVYDNDDQESLLDVDEFDHHSQNLSICSRGPEQSFAKKKISERPSYLRQSQKKIPNGRPLRKKIEPKTPRQSFKPIVLEKKEGAPPLMSKEALRKKLKLMKIPQKYEKVLEGMAADTLEIIDLTNAELGDKVLGQFLPMLGNCNKVRTVKLIRNKLSDEGLAHLLPHFASVTTLNLSQNLLTEQTLGILNEYLPNLPALKTIVLSQNKITQRKSRGVIDVLRKHGLTLSV